SRSFRKVHIPGEGRKTGRAGPCGGRPGQCDGDCPSDSGEKAGLAEVVWPDWQSGGRKRMIPDRVIVTIQSADGKFHGDYELPANVPVKMFKEQLISGLALLAPQAFEPCRILGAGLFVKEQGKLERIPDEDTLAAHGVWDGSFVSVLRLEH